jgi:hypothetical protein
MGVVIKVDFKAKINSKLSKFNPRNTRQEYHVEIFSEMFDRFPQFKAHAAAFVERHYCVVVNDEDHPSPESLISLLKPEEVRKLNEWILSRHNRASVIKTS